MDPYDILCHLPRAFILKVVSLINDDMKYYAEEYVKYLGEEHAREQKKMDEKNNKKYITSHDEYDQLADKHLITHLEINMTHSDFCRTKYWDTFEDFPRIKWLSITINDWELGFSGVFINRIICMPELETLIIGANTYCYFRYGDESIYTNSNLKNLKFKTMHHHHDFSSIYYSWPKLKYISVDNKKISRYHSDNHYIPSPLRNVHKIKIINSVITPDYMLRFTECVDTLILILRNNGIESIEQLINMPNLHTLDIRNNPVKDLHLLAKMPNLRRVLI